MTTARQAKPAQLPRRIAQPQIAPAADEALALLRQLAADIAMIRQRIEGNAADTPEKPDVIDKEDTIAIKDAAFLANVSDDTMRRWAKNFGLSVVFCHTVYISRSKLQTYLATRRGDDD